MSTSYTTFFGSSASLLLLLSCFLWLEGCKHPAGDPIDPVDPGDGETEVCDPDVVYFERDILPILISNCTQSGCHDAATAQDGVVLTSYERIMATADVRPFDPEDSDLYEVLVEDDAEDRMPKDAPPLPADQIALIRKWISQGAKNLSCTETGSCNTENVSFSGFIQPLLRNNCTGCHSTGLASGGINLSTHAGVQMAATSGRLLPAIRHESSDPKKYMPQNGPKLPQCDIDKIAAWVAAGTPNN